MGESVTEKTPWIYESPDGGKTVYKYERGTDTLKRELVDVDIEMADVDDQRAHHFGHNTVPPYITKTFKYEEDAILKQAEDGIRDSSTSRGRGDVYKRQPSGDSYIQGVFSVTDSPIK